MQYTMRTFLSFYSYSEVVKYGTDKKAVSMQEENPLESFQIRRILLYSAPNKVRTIEITLLTIWELIQKIRLFEKVRALQPLFPVFQHCVALRS